MLFPDSEKMCPEQVYEELCKLLLRVTAADLQHNAAALAGLIPELAPAIGFDQRSPHHAYDLFTHIAYVTEATPPILPLRWAALLHDIGKVPTFTLDETGRGHFYGHAEASARMADTILRRLKAPAALRETAVLLIRGHMTKIEPEKQTVRRWLDRLGPETLRLLLLLQEADMASKGTGERPEMEQFPRLRELITQIQAEAEPV